MDLYVVDVCMFQHPLCCSLGLPSFFQTNAKTVIDELQDFELGGNMEEDEQLPLEEDGLGEEDKDLDTFGDDNDAFGDLNVNSLPDFFRNPRNSALEENFSIFDSTANITIDDDIAPSGKKQRKED
jgi:hypothetical protein